MERYKGQALIVALAFTAALGGVLLLVFNVGQLANGKHRLLATADAAAGACRARMRASEVGMRLRCGRTQANGGPTLPRPPGGVQAPRRCTACGAMQPLHLRMRLK